MYRKELWNCHSIEFVGKVKSFATDRLFFSFFFSSVYLDLPIEVFFRFCLKHKAFASVFVFLLLLLVIVLGRTDGMFAWLQSYRSVASTLGHTGEMLCAKYSIWKFHVLQNEMPSALEEKIMAEVSKHISGHVMLSIFSWFKLNFIHGNQLQGLDFTKSYKYFL